MRTLLTLAILASTFSLNPATPAVAKPRDTRPNIILITTDDMTETDMAWMPHTNRLLKRAGVDAKDFVSPHPLCCPARAEILTGQYAHNNGVHHNAGPYGGFSALRSDTTIGTRLNQAGYKTAFVGKFLNSFEATPRNLPGWDVFNPTIKGIYSSYGFTMWNNGDPKRVNRTHTSDYVGKMTGSYIRSFAKRDKPFFIWASQVAPHKERKGGDWVPLTPARRHVGMFAGVQSPSMQKASYNRAPDDNGAYPRARTRSLEEIGDLHQARIESLQSVDEAVARTVRVLRKTGELKNTYIFFTSDNGYLLGEHQIVDKDVPYEEALQVPMVVRGPSLPRGAVRGQTMTMIDLAPTFMDIAGKGASYMDGASMLPGLRSRKAKGYTTTLIQSGDRRNPWEYRGVRTRRYTIVRYADTGMVQMYDRRRDPAQLRNVADAPRYRGVKRELMRSLRRLQDCQAAVCRARSGL